MSDTGVEVAVSVLALMLLHGALHHRATVAAERQMREAYPVAGTIRAKVREQAPFGVFASDLRAVDVYGTQVRADGMPFVQTPRSGWKGSIQHLRLHLIDSDFAGIHAARVEVDVPDVKYDLGYAFYDTRLYIRSARPGTISIWVEQKNLAAFAIGKYGRLLHDLNATMQGDRLELSGNLDIAGALAPFLMDGRIVIREGRFIEIPQADIMLNGKRMAPDAAAGLLKRFNPILDVEKDLHAGRILRVRSVSGDGDQIEISGDLQIPVREKR